VTATAVAVLAAVLFILPLPNATLTQGIVLAPPGSVVRAETPGVVTEVIAEPDTKVAQGDPLLKLEDPTLRAMAAATKARLDELNRRRDALPRENRVEARVLAEEIARAEDHLGRYRERIEALTVRAPAAGRFILPGADDLVGRFVRRGQELGFTLAPRGMWVRAVVPESHVALVRAGSRNAEVRLASRMTEVLPGRVAREVPAAGDLLPSVALAGAGGGPFAAERTPEDGARALVPIFQFEIAFDDVTTARLGERAHIRFDHGDASLAEMLWRGLRQLFLSQFDV
jgi:putative peptide zinc metalloprotease protein